MAFELEKLGLSVPNKDHRLPYNLKTFVQALEQKGRETEKVFRHFPMNSARFSETDDDTPAMDSLKMKKTAGNFDFSREMTIDKQTRAVDGFNRGSVKKGAGNKTDMESRTMPVDIYKQDTEKGTAASRAGADALPMPGNVSKTDGTGRQETHQNLTSGAEKYQSAGASYASVAENLSAPAKQAAGFQQGLNPTSVVNQVGKEIAAFLHRGDRIFTLQLKPPELGIVNIEMDVKENILKMSVVTETSSAKDMLHANYVDLKRVLEGYGIRVETFDVQLNGNLNHSSANGDGFLDQQHHSQGRFGKNLHSGELGTDTAGDGKADSLVPSRTNNESLLDLLA